MPRIAYFDCFAGASGDMILGALVDAGLPFAELSEAISHLDLSDGAFELRCEPVLRAGFAATKVDVEVREPPTHRSLGDVQSIVERSSLARPDKDNVTRIFRALGEAEARTHGLTLSAVELHEVGAVDAMVDITGAVVGLRLLGVERVFVSPLPLGHGEVKGAHGAIPIPAPATIEMLARAGAEIRQGEGPRGEQVTPTGAAILTTLGRFERPAMRIEKVGCGAGSRDPLDRPNILRLWLGDAEVEARTMRLLETNIDDMTPELLGHAQERLMAAGAADAWFSAIQMKKNRPAVMLSVLCSEAQESQLVNIILRETTTLGIRSRDVTRYEAEREQFEFDSSLGRAAVKVKRLPGEAPRVAPEYEVCRRLAEERGLPLTEVYRIVALEAERHLRP